MPNKFLYKSPYINEWTHFSTDKNNNNTSKSKLVSGKGRWNLHLLSALPSAR